MSESKSTLCSGHLNPRSLTEMQNYIKRKTCRNKNSTEISGEHSINDPIHNITYYFIQDDRKDKKT